MTKGEELTKKYKTLLKKYEVDTPLRLAYFWGQLEAESNLEPKRESGYYKTIIGLRNTFKTPFKGKPDSFVEKYLRNSEKCLNYVYANREGNGDESSGDGYKYRGGGIIMKTFKNGYASLTKKTGIDFLNNPDLIIEEANSLISALIHWNDNGLNKYADLDNLDAVSDIINMGSRTKQVGDSNGYIHRKEAVEKYKKIFK